MAFKMKGWSAFTKPDPPATNTAYKPGTLYGPSDSGKPTNVSTSKTTGVNKAYKGNLYGPSKSQANKKILKKTIGKVAKKVGSRLIPGVGLAMLGVSAVKEIKSGGAGIKKNIQDVKNFFSKK